MNQLTQLIVAFLSGCMVFYLNREYISRVVERLVKPKTSISNSPKLRLIKGNKRNNVSSKSNN